MVESPCQQSTRSTGKVMQGSSSNTKQILRANQPRSFLLSLEKKTPQTVTQNRVKLQVPIGLANPRNEARAIKLEISRPKQITQSSLSALRERGREDIRMYHERYKPPAGRSVAPRKPNRPRYIPSMLDLSKPLEQVPSFQSQYSVSTTEKKDDNISGLVSPITFSSRPSSSTSSDGSIPDFPMPLGTRLSRRNSPLTSLPNSKRALSSYYSHPSIIPPIPEEPFSSKTSSSHTYASSAALPSTARQSVELPKYRPITQSSTEISSKPISRKMSGTKVVTEFELSDDNSVGMALTSDSDNAFELRQPMSINFVDEKRHGSSGTAYYSDKNKILVAGNISLDQGFTRKSEKFRERKSSKPESLGLKISPINSEVIGEFESTNSLPPSFHCVTNSNPKSGAQNLSSSPTKFHRYPDKRQNTHSDNVKPQEVDPRTSVTSLHYLIDRASRLLDAMDRGKHYKMNNHKDHDFRLKDNEEMLYEKDRNQSSRVPRLVRLLSPSPSPSTSFHLSEKIPLNTLHTESPNVVNEKTWSDEKWLTADSVVRKNIHFRNPCCGLPLKIFVAVVLLFVILIASSIFISIFFLIIRKSSITDRSKTIESCNTSGIDRCQNGGFSYLLNNDTCACICSNGFTGGTCTTNSSSSFCSTISYAGHEATVGNSIEGLLLNAQKKFNIPLDMGLILTRFNLANLSCLAENALVTYRSRNFRKDLIVDNPTILISRSNKLRRRQIQSEFSLASSTRTMIPHTKLSTPVIISSTSTNLSTASSDSTSTVFVTITPTLMPSFTTTTSITEPSTTTVTVTISPTYTSSVSVPLVSLEPSKQTTRETSNGSHQPTPSSPLSPDPAVYSSLSSTTIPLLPTFFSPTEVTLDFARVVTLYILQKTNLNEALNIQSSFQDLFDSKITLTSAQNFTLSSISRTITIDLLLLSLDLADGMGVIGGQTADQITTKTVNSLSTSAVIEVINQHSDNA